jgi:DUF1365 family protein
MLYVIYLKIIFHVRYKPMEHKFFDNIFTIYVNNQNCERHSHYLTLPNSLWCHETVQQALMFCLIQKILQIK